MLRKIVLGILVSVCVLSTALAASETGDESEKKAPGVGILDAAEQAGLNITCPAGAANCETDKSKEAEYYSTQGTQTFILRVFGGVLNFAAIAAVLMLVIAAIRLVIAHGSQDKLQEAKKHILWTLAGLAVIILSLLIVRNVTETIYEATEGDEAPVVEEEPEDVPCEKSAPATIPPACYGTANQDLNQTQSANSNECAEALELCGDLGVDPCSVKAIQTKVAGHYDDPNASCSKADGLYGQCTKKAIENYFDENGCE